MSGYNVRPDASFAALLTVHLQTVGRRLAPVPLKRHALIADAVSTDHPDIVVLQLGNYEFHASYRRLFTRYMKSGKMPAGGSPQTEREDATIEVPQESWLKKLIRYGALPFFVLYLILRNRSFLNRIRAVVRQHPESRFIILSPIPCLSPSDNISRRMAGKYFRLKFCRMPNVRYTDLHGRQALFNKTCYSDASHLNERGHRILFEHISRLV